MPSNYKIADGTTISPHDMHDILSRIPHPVGKAMRKSGAILAGGFIRDCITREKINDADLFASGKDHAKQIVSVLEDADCEVVCRTENATTLKTERGFTVQVIHRWTFDSPAACLESFDFTTCAAAVSFRVDGDDVFALGLCCPSFYSDLAAKRLVYRSPVREEEPGGSIMRAMKFIRRGYYLPPEQLALLIVRLMSGIGPGDGGDSYDRGTDTHKAKVICGLLREVDPALVTIL